MKLKTQLADIRSRYTERFPDYRRLKEQIAQLESMKQQMTEDLQAAAKSKKDSAPTETPKESTEAHPTSFAEMKEMSPMLQLQGQLKQNQMELENRQKIVSQLETQIQQYQNRLNETPIREQHSISPLVPVRNRGIIVMIARFLARRERRSYNSDNLHEGRMGRIGFWRGKSRPGPQPFSQRASAAPRTRVRGKNHGRQRSRLAARRLAGLAALSRNARPHAPYL